MLVGEARWVLDLGNQLQFDGQSRPRELLQPRERLHDAMEDPTCHAKAARGDVLVALEPEAERRDGVVMEPHAPRVPHRVAHAAQVGQRGNDETSRQNRRPMLRGDPTCS